MTRVTEVTKAQKDQGVCGRCGDPLPAGSPYRYAKPGFRGSKIVRCLKPGCAFRQSELTTSKLAEVYAAQEDAADELAEITDPADLAGVAESYASRVREVAQEYADAAEAMGGAGDEMQERADELEAHADEVEGFDASDYTKECVCAGEGDEECECEGTGEVPDVDEAKEALETLIGDLPL